MTRAYVGDFQDGVFLSAKPRGEQVALNRAKMVEEACGMYACNDQMLMPPEYARDLASQLMSAATKADEFRKASPQRVSQQK